jgi:peptidyl-prolyl cis-trans isomerase B (cyclophilin B)
MKRTLAVLLLAWMPLWAWAGPTVKISTSLGDIKVVLDNKRAPNTVNNFLSYVNQGFYSGTVFHRVIAGFMVQGGGYDQRLQEKATAAPIRIEADNGLKNSRGTIAMARTNDPNSATAQFFINLKDNDFLNYRAPTMQGWGYTVFGRVVSGMGVVDRIARLKTGAAGMFGQDVPNPLVIINRIEVVK